MFSDFSANQYLVQLLEDKGAVSFQPMTEERIRLVFQVLDKVSPQLGTFSRLMGLLGAELHGKNDNLFCLHCWYSASCISRVHSGYPYPPTNTHWKEWDGKVNGGYHFPPLMTHWRFLPHQPEVYSVQDYGGYPFPLGEYPLGSPSSRVRSVLY